MKSSTRSRLTGSPLIWSTPSIIWMGLQGRAIARQDYYALDVVGRIVLRQAEHDDVAAVGLRRPDASREQRRGERQRIVAVAVGVFRHEKVVADEQRRLHRARWNIEGLEQEGANDERDNEGVKDHAPG